MEIVTLIPMQGKDCFQNFIEANSWTNNYFPIQDTRLKEAAKIKKVFLRRCVEKIFCSGLGDFTDRWLMNLTDKRWEKKTLQGKVNDHGVKIAMMVNRHFSKPDPRNFQAKIVHQYESRIQQLLKKLTVTV
jgi:hypothetical protein